jgi:CRP/FNR family transcriptional regulator, cyclic AMP receptor protein
MQEITLSDALHENPWFAALDEPQFEAMLAIATEASWPAGTLIFKEGEPNQNIYLVCQGLVALDIHVPMRGRTTILTLNEGDVFGWSAILPVVNIKTASARAMQETRAIAFDGEGMQAACDKDHELGYHVFRRLTNVVAARLTATRMQLLDMYSTGNEGDC